MLAYLCIVIVVLLTIVTGNTFRKRCVNNQNTTCLAMLVVMTQSTIVGILVAHFLPDMVLSTIIAITISFLLTCYLTYGLPIRTFIESLGALLMGAMMGAMLNLMTTSYLNISFIFFTSIFILSTIFAIGFLLKDEDSSLKYTIPKHVMLSAIISVLFLVFGSISTFFSSPTEHPEQEIHHHH